MRGAALLVLACALALLVPVVAVSPLSSGAAAAADDTSFLSVTVTPAIVRAGDVAILDLYTYSGGNLTNAETAPAFMMRTPKILPPNVTQVGLGHYRASFSTSLFAGVGGPAEAIGFPMYAYATVGGQSVTAFTMIPILQEGFWMRAYLDRSVLLPGDSAQITAEVLNGTTPVDASLVTASVHSTNLSLMRMFTLNRTGLGTYAASFQLPVYDPATDSPYMQVSAAIGDHLPLVRMVPFIGRSLQAWYHQTSTDAFASYGRLWVADERGGPAPGVTVNLTVANGGIAYLNGTTDAQGSLALTLPYGPLHQVEVTMQLGPPSAGSRYVGTFYPPGSGYGRAVPTDPTLLPDGSPRDYLIPGETVVRRFLAIDRDLSHLAVPQPGEPIEYFAWTYSGFVSHGRTVSDATGAFAVSFRAPGADVVLEIVRGNASPDYTTYRVASPLAGFGVTPLALGSATSIRIFAAGGLQRFGELLDAFARVSVLSATTSEFWQAWNAPAPWGQPLVRGPTNITGDVYLPSFLPRDVHYVVGASIAGSPGLADQFAVLTVGQGADLPIGGRVASGLPIVWVAMSVVAAVAAVAAAAILVRRRRRPPPKT